MYQAFLVKYAEIGIKGKNRYKFENSNQIFIFAIRQYAYHNTMWIIGKGLHRQAFDYKSKTF